MQTKKNWSALTQTFGNNTSPKKQYRQHYFAVDIAYIQWWIEDFWGQRQNFKRDPYWQSAHCRPLLF